ncbi:hypothetical protein [Mycobacteroides chelonae]|uniref:hypothetical protein n=1 Tax=Mycobacteroides chelonae TaxID=1774 RepID=UPI001A9785B6|nr:hypothetical protein [Mycobacteroides chelonae]
MTAGMLAAALLNACTAHAEPPKLPDISGYTPVNAQDYAIDTTTPGHPSTGTYFVTPDGIMCGFSNIQAQCTGNNFPAVAPAISDPDRGINGVNWIGTTTGLQQTNEGPVSGKVHGQVVKTLPPFQSIAVGGTICGVDDSGTTACKDSQGRGFVLSPKGSGWLPKV